MMGLADGEFADGALGEGDGDVGCVAAALEVTGQQPVENVPGLVRGGMQGDVAMSRGSVVAVERSRTFAAQRPIDHQHPHGGDRTIAGHPHPDVECPAGLRTQRSATSVVLVATPSWISRLATSSSDAPIWAVISTSGTA